MGRLVQQSPAAGAHRQHPAGRGRGALLRHAGPTSHGSVTQTKQPPTNPGRFMASENRGWGYDRIAGALANLGYDISDQTVGNVLRRYGLLPAPERKHTTTW